MNPSSIIEKNKKPKHLMYDIKKENFEKEIDHVFSIVSAHRAKDPELFNATHTEIIAIKGNDEYINERDLLVKLKTHIKNNLLTDDFKFLNPSKKYFIKGETGTGKSELAWYLKLELEKDEALKKNLKIIDIPKNFSWLLIVNEILIPKIEEILPYKLEFGDYTSDSFDKLKDDYKNNKEKTSFELATEIAGVLYDKGLLEEEIKEYYDDIVKPIVNALKNNLKNMFLKLDIDTDEKIYQKIFNNSTRKLLSQEIPWKHSLQTDEDLKKELNAALTKALKKKYNIPSLNEVLSKMVLEIQKNLENDTKIPRILLIFEDFGLEDEDANNFGKFMNVDDYNFIDYLIAGTPNSFSDLHLVSSLDDRVEIYWTNNENAIYTKFLSSENIVEFIGKYIKFFKRRLKEKYNPNVDCNSFYPFSEIFIKRVFQCLEPEDKKPRELIKKFSEMLNSCYYGQYPYKIAKKSIPNRSFITSDIIKQYYHGINEEHKDFLVWYGKLDKQLNKLSFSNELAESFYLNYKKFEVKKPKEIPKITKKVERENKSDEELFLENLEKKLNDLEAYYNMWVDLNNENHKINSIDFYFKTGFTEIIKKLNNLKIIEKVHLDKSEFFNALYLKNSENNEIQIKKDENNVYIKFINPIDLYWFSKKEIEKFLKIGIINLEKKKLSNVIKITEKYSHKFKEELIDSKYIVLESWFSDFRNKCIKQMSFSGSKILFNKKHALKEKSFVEFLIFTQVVNHLLNDPFLKMSSVGDIYEILYSDPKSNKIKILDKEIKEFFVRIIKPYSQIFQNEGNVIIDQNEVLIGKINQDLLLDSTRNVIENFIKSPKKNNFYRKLKMDKKSPLTNNFHSKFLNFYEINSSTKTSKRNEIIKELKNIKEFYVEIYDIEIKKINDLIKNNSNVNFFKGDIQKIDEFLKKVEKERENMGFKAKSEIITLFSFYEKLAYHIPKIFEIIINNIRIKKSYRLYNELIENFSRKRVTMDYNKLIKFKKVIT